MNLNNPPTLNTINVPVRVVATHSGDNNGKTFNTTITAKVPNNDTKILNLATVNLSPIGLHPSDYSLDDTGTIAIGVTSDGHYTDNGSPAHWVKQTGNSSNGDDGFVPLNQNDNSYGTQDGQKPTIELHAQLNLASVQYKVEDPHSVKNGQIITISPGSNTKPVNIAGPLSSGTNINLNNTNAKGLPTGYQLKNPSTTIKSGHNNIVPIVVKPAQVTYKFGNATVGSGTANVSNTGNQNVNSNDLLNIPNGYAVDPRQSSISVNDLSQNNVVQLDATGKWGTATWDLTPSDDSDSSVNPANEYGTGNLYIHDGNLQYAWKSTSEKYGNEIKTINFSNVQAPSDSSYLFGYMPSVNTIDVKGLNTTGVTAMDRMFAGNDTTNLKYIYNLGSLDVSDVNDMYSMFQGNLSLNPINSDNGLSDWDTSRVTNMSSMFESDEHLNNNTIKQLANWNTSSVTNVADIFLDIKPLSDWSPVAKNWWFNNKPSTSEAVGNGQANDTKVPSNMGNPTPSIMKATTGPHNGKYMFGQTDTVQFPSDISANTTISGTYYGGNATINAPLGWHFSDGSTQIKNVPYDNSTHSYNVYRSSVELDFNDPSNTKKTITGLTGKTLNINSYVPQYYHLDNVTNNDIINLNLKNNGNNYNVNNVNNNKLNGVCHIDIPVKPIHRNATVQFKVADSASKKNGDVIGTDSTDYGGNDYNTGVGTYRYKISDGMKGMPSDYQLASSDNGPYINCENTTQIVYVTPKSGYFENIVFKYNGNGSQEGSTTTRDNGVTGSYMTSSTLGAAGDISDQIHGLNPGWHIDNDGSNTFTFDNNAHYNNAHVINVVPNTIKVTVNYKDNGASKGTYQFTLNDNRTVNNANPDSMDISAGSTWNNKATDLAKGYHVTSNNPLSYTTDKSSDTQSPTVNVVGNPVTYKGTITWRFNDGQNTIVKSTNYSDKNVKVGNTINILRVGNPSVGDPSQYVDKDDGGFTANGYNYISNGSSTLSDYQFTVPSDDNPSNPNDNRVTKSTGHDVTFNYNAQPGAIKENITYIDKASNNKVSSYQFSGDNGATGSLNNGDTSDTSQRATGLSAGWQVDGNQNWNYGATTGSKTIYVTPIQRTDKVYFKYAGPTASYQGPTGTLASDTQDFKGNDSRARFSNGHTVNGTAFNVAKSLNDAKTAGHLNIKDGLTFDELINNYKIKDVINNSNYDGQTHTVELVPKDKSNTENIHYKYGSINSKQEGSTTVKGDYKFQNTFSKINKTVSDSSYPATGLNPGWHITSGNTFTFGDNNNSDDIIVEPNKVTVTVHYINQNGQKVGSDTLPSGNDYRATDAPNRSDVITNSNEPGLPAGYSLKNSSNDIKYYSNQTSQNISVVGDKSDNNRINIQYKNKATSEVLKNSDISDQTGNSGQYTIASIPGYTYDYASDGNTRLTANGNKLSYTTTANNQNWTIYMNGQTNSADDAIVKYVNQHNQVLNENGDVISGNSTGKISGATGTKFDVLNNPGTEMPKGYQLASTSNPISDSSANNSAKLTEADSSHIEGEIAAVGQTITIHVTGDPNDHTDAKPITVIYKNQNGQVLKDDGTLGSGKTGATSASGNVSNASGLRIPTGYKFSSASDQGGMSLDGSRTVNDQSNLDYEVSNADQTITVNVVPDTTQHNVAKPVNVRYINQHDQLLNDDGSVKENNYIMVLITPVRSLMN